MSIPPDIIGTVKLLQRMTLDNKWTVGGIGPEHLWKRFPAIAQALLDREEKLRIAVEALEDIQKVHLEASTRPGGYVSVSSQVMCNKTFEALSLIRSPLPS